MIAPRQAAFLGDERGRMGRSGSGLGRVEVGALGLILLAGGFAPAQTMARPGWAGSGMRAEPWWKGAVICEVRAGGAGSGAMGAAGGESVLHRLLGHMDDLQTLSADAVLLRGIDVEGAAGGPEGQAGRMNPAFGAAAEFDDLMQEASRRRIRVLVELAPQGLGEKRMQNARFWLSRGVAGVVTGPLSMVELREMRGVVRGYAGERVVITTADPGVAAGIAAGATESPGADLVMYPLRGLEGATPDVAALRASIQAVQTQGEAVRREGAGRRGGAAGVPLVEAGVGAHAGATGAESEARAAVLLSVGTAVALDVSETVGRLVPAASSAGLSQENPVLDWNRRVLGLLRGDATIRGGARTMLNRDTDRALVTVWRGEGPKPKPVMAIVNLSDQPLRMSLVDDLGKMGMHGIFLRTILRSDGGMGAMPLRAVTLPAFGVFVGQMGR